LRISLFFRGIVKADQIVLYSDESKVKYAKPQRKPKFNEGIDELEKDVGGDIEVVNEEVPEESTEEISQVKKVRSGLF